jgi:hypothetical protein
MGTEELVNKLKRRGFRIGMSGISSDGFLLTVNGRMMKQTDAEKLLRPVGEENFMASSREAIRNLLTLVERECGAQVPYAITPLANGVAGFQINVWPRLGEADFLTIEALRGVNRGVEITIRNWFEPIAKNEVAL